MRAAIMRAAIIVLIAAVITFALMFFVAEDGRPCPEGQMAVLAADKWECVKRGGE